MRGNGREEYLAMFGSLVIPPRGVFFACLFCTALTMCVPPRGAETREVEGEVERAAVLNRA